MRNAEGRMFVAWGLWWKSTVRGKYLV